MDLRILIVDDHAILRQGLIALLRDQLPASQVREAGDGLTAINTCREWKPDIVLMDVSLPVLNGLDALRQILVDHPAMRVLMLSAHTGSQLVNEAMDAGAMGFVAKESAFEEVVLAIQTILDGNRYLSKRLTAQHERGADLNITADAKLSLTTRELDVLELLAGGQAMKEVAGHLGVSIKTVETHRRNIMDKLGIFSVAELTKYALRTGLTPLYGNSTTLPSARPDGAADDAASLHG
jgi:DNA-binding NarL/FixJ family response regulator